MLNPCIAVVSAEYSTISPLLNPWFLKVTTFNEVDIPVGLTLNLRCVYPEPSSKTLTATKVFLLSVLNLWIPLADVSVDNPIVFIPAVPNKASVGVLNILTVVGLTDLTKYGAPSDNVPATIFAGSKAVPIPIGEFPFEP